MNYALNNTLYVKKHVKYHFFSIWSNKKISYPTDLFFLYVLF